MGEQDIVISTRIPKQTLIEIQKAVNNEYTSESDFFRSAIRSELFKQRIRQIKDELEKTQDSVKAVRNFRKLLSELPEDEYGQWVQEEAKDMKG